MSKKLKISLSKPGADSLKGGIFFDSTLLPKGIFQNSPNYTEIEVNDNEQDGRLVSNLQKLKKELEKKAKKLQGDDVVLNEDNINQFLQQFINLLIDYSELRNYVFFGSSYNELNYQIKNIIEKYPFKAYIAKDVNSTSGLQFENLSGNRTQITFNFEDVLEGQLLKFREDIINNWTNYEFVDKLNNRFEIEGIISPYNQIQNVQFISVASTNFIEITTSLDHNYNNDSVVDVLIIDDNGEVYISDRFKVDVISSNQFRLRELYNSYIKISQFFKGTNSKISTNFIHGLNNGDIIVVSNTNIPGLDNQKFLVDNVNDYSFEIKTLAGVSINSLSWLNFQGTGRIAKVYTENTPIIFNSGYSRFSVEIQPEKAYQGNFQISFIIKGLISKNNLIEYEVLPSKLYKGLVLSPKNNFLIDFEINLEPIQKSILYNNPEPWPREVITQNIITYNPKFSDWSSSPNNLTRADINDIGVVQIPEDEGLNLTSALGLDETYTNQLIRRCIPSGLIDEIGDPNGDFSRFILIAGKFFDYIKIYIDFLKYTHSLNYEEFNQLSPNFYELYAQHYGFNLVANNYTNEGDLSLSVNDITFKEISYNKQKKLLLNLLYLYKTKGTHACIKYLMVGLGFPANFVKIDEFFFNTFKEDDGITKALKDCSFDYDGLKKVENNKVFVPDFTFEIDPDYTIVEYINKLKLQINFNYYVTYIYYDVENKPVKFITFESDTVTNQTGQTYLFNFTDFTNQTFKIFAEDPNNQSTKILLGEALLLSPDETVSVISQRLVNSINSRTQFTEISASLNTITNEITLYYPIQKRNWLVTTEGILGVENPDDLIININFRNTSYRYRLDNEEDYNLREINVFLDSQNAVLSDMIDKNSFNVTFGKFETRNYANLQNENQNYHLLPLSYPDKYYGVGIRYMIPKDGFKDIKGSKRKRQIDLASLYQVSNINLIAPNNLELLNQQFDYPDLPERCLGVLVFDDFNVLKTITVKIKDNSLNFYDISDLIAEIGTENLIESLVENINSYAANTYGKFLAQKAEGLNAIYVYGPAINNIDINGFQLFVTGTAAGDVKEYHFTNVTNQYDYEKPFIINRLEDEHLVVRIRVDDETGVKGQIKERIAVYKNLFVDDGLLHHLRLNYRDIGVEVFLDTKFIGLAKWISTNDPILGDIGKSVLELDVNQIIEYIDNNTAIYEPLDYQGLLNSNSLISNPPNNSGEDLVRWWDLFVGNPINIDLFYESVQVFESPAISYDNPILLDSINRLNETEIYDFKFVNNVAENNSAMIIPAQFRRYEPNNYNSISEDYYIPTQANNIIPTINLINKIYNNKNNNWSLGVSVVSKVTDFYSKKSNETLDADLLFKNNAWDSTIHSDRKYSKLNSAFENYYSLFKNTITYDDLLPFFENADERFKNLVKDFIPIVVNINKFGMAVANHAYLNEKNYYNKVYKICNVENLTPETIGIIKVLDGYDGTIQIKLNNSNLILTDVLAFTINKFITAQLIVDNINSKTFYPNIKAKRNGNLVIIYINPVWYDNIYNLYPGDENFVLALNDNFPAEIVQQPTGGVLENISSDCAKISYIYKEKVFDETIYLYFHEENFAPLIIYYKAEFKPFFYV